MIQCCLHNNCGSLSLALIMRLLSSSAITCWFGFTCSCLPAPRAWQWDEEGVQGLCAWPGFPFPGSRHGRELTTAHGKGGEGVLCCWDPGGGLEHHHSGLEHHGILVELDLNPFCMRFSHLHTENSWVYLFAREGIQ